MSKSSAMSTLMHSIWTGDINVCKAIHFWMYFLQYCYSINIYPIYIYYNVTMSASFGKTDVKYSFKTTAHVSM